MSNTITGTGWTPGAGAPLSVSHAKTPQDNLLLPDGRKLGEVSDLASVLVGLQISGASHENGRLKNAEAYAAHLQKLGDEGARARVASWLDQHKPEPPK